MTSVALLHPSGLLGNELREKLGERRELWRKVRLLTTDGDEAGTLTEVAGAAAMVTEIESGDLDRVEAAFFCGGIDDSRPLVAALPETATAIVLSPDAAPEDGHPVVAGVNLETARSGGPILSPHPGTVLLAHLLHPLRDFRPARATATLLQPVSVYDRAALGEVFEQTRGLLRFEANPPREIFPVQIAFNVIPNREDANHMIPHLRTVLGPRGAAAELSAQVLQAGVFHGYGVSLHVVLESDPGPDEVREALAAHPAVDMAIDPEHLGVIDAAGRDEVVVGRIEPAAGLAGGYWIWAVMDNLTCGGAVNALRIFEAVLDGVVH